MPPIPALAPLTRDLMWKWRRMRIVSGGPSIRQFAQTPQVRQQHGAHDSPWGTASARLPPRP